MSDLSSIHHLLLSASDNAFGLATAWIENSELSLEQVYLYLLLDDAKRQRAESKAVETDAVTPGKVVSYDAQTPTTGGEQVVEAATPTPEHVQLGQQRDDLDTALRWARRMLHHCIRVTLSDLPTLDTGYDDVPQSVLRDLRTIGREAEKLLAVHDAS